MDNCFNNTGMVTVYFKLSHMHCLGSHFSVCLNHVNCAWQFVLLNREFNGPYLQSYQPVCVIVCLHDELWTHIFT